MLFQTYLASKDAAIAKVPLGLYIGVVEQKKAHSRRWMRWGVLIALAIAAFLPRLGARDIVTSHEARVAQTARQMAACGWPWNARWIAVPPGELVTDAAGKKYLQPQWTKPPMWVNPWLIPVMSGQIRLQKPPLPYWCAAALYRLAGVEWSERLTRMVPAILGALATLILFDFVQLTMGRNAAWCSALVWVSSYFIIEQFRLAMADPYLAFFTLACMWLWVRASVNERGTKANIVRVPRSGTPGRAGEVEAHGLEYQTVAPGSGMRAWMPSRRVILLKLFYVFLALGILAKGPVIFVPLIPGIVLYHVYLRRPIPKSMLGHAVGIVVLLILVVPWYWYVLQHVPNALEIWRYESVGELPGSGNVEKPRAAWFYFADVWLINLPWTAIWFAGIAIAVARRRRGKCMWPIYWYAVVVLFFTLLPVKKDTYLLPIMPAQAMIPGLGLVSLMAIVRRFPRHALLAWIQVGIGIGGAIAALVLAARIHQTAALVIALLSLAAACGAVAELRARQGRLWLWRQTIAYTLAIIVIFDFFNAQRDNLRSARPVCQELVAMMRETHQPLAPGHVPEEAALYLPLDMPVKREAASMLVIVDDPKNTKQAQPAEFADRVPWRRILSVHRVTMKSAPDNARWKVYRLQLATD